MTTTIKFEEFETKALDLLSRMAAIEALHTEAEELVLSLDFDSLSEDEQDEAYEYAHDIARTGGYSFAGWDEGFWLPSTC